MRDDHSCPTCRIIKLTRAAGHRRNPWDPQKKILVMAAQTSADLAVPLRRDDVPRGDIGVLHLAGLHGLAVVARSGHELDALDGACQWMDRRVHQGIVVGRPHSDRPGYPVPASPRSRADGEGVRGNRTRMLVP